MTPIISEALDETARDILRRNDRGGYTVPTAGLYPYQWNWDSAFAALAFAEFDVARAWTELETLAGGQWENGMIPHILFHKPDPGYFPGPDVWDCPGPVPSSGISQPPIAASFARRIFEKDPEAGAAPMARLWPKLKTWHGWFMDWRLDKGAVCVTHPWEAGRDNAPDWDGGLANIDPVGVGPYTRRDTSHVNPEMRPTKYDYDRYIWLVERGRRLGWDEERMLADTPFRIADPTMTFTLLRAQRDLKMIGETLDQDMSGVEGWIATLEAGAETLWNPDLGCYDSRDALTGQWAGCVSNASFLCWYAGIDDDRMRTRYDSMMACVPFGMPSHDPASDRFDGKRYWRGPTWGIMNMLIGLGLEDAGLAGRATDLRRRTARLIADHGFAEYFDPRDGTPAGGGIFTWTAATWLVWAGKSEEQN